VVATHFPKGWCGAGAEHENILDIAPWGYYSNIIFFLKCNIIFGHMARNVGCFSNIRLRAAPLEHSSVFTVYTLHLQPVTWPVFLNSIIKIKGSPTQSAFSSWFAHVHRLVFMCILHCIRIKFNMWRQLEFVIGCINILAYNINYTLIEHVNCRT